METFLCKLVELEASPKIIPMLHAGPQGVRSFRENLEVAQLECQLGESTGVYIPQGWGEEGSDGSYVGSL